MTHFPDPQRRQGRKESGKQESVRTSEGGIENRGWWHTASVLADEHSPLLETLSALERSFSCTITTVRRSRQTTTIYHTTCYRHRQESILQYVIFCLLLLLKVPTMNLISSEFAHSAPSHLIAVFLLLQRPLPSSKKIPLNFFHVFPYIVRSSTSKWCGQVKSSLSKF